MPTNYPKPSERQVVSLLHGSTIWTSWLTSDGAKPLHTLQTVPTETIQEASGVDYDGMEYGDLTPR